VARKQPGGGELDDWQERRIFRPCGRDLVLGRRSHVPAFKLRIGHAARSDEPLRKFHDVIGGTICMGSDFTAIMEPADGHRQPTEEEFRAEALRWLPSVSRYARLLTRNKSDADDLAQETFLRAYLSWTTFRPGSDCRKWLFTICRHLFLRAQQRDSRIVGVDDPEADIEGTAELFWEAEASGLTDLFNRIDLGPAIERGLHAIQPEYREAVILVDVEDCSYADAAAAIGVPVGTIRSRLFRGRRLLQQTLMEHARDIGLGTPASSRNDDEGVLA
jgi:RNA polymerase sigma-70 factor (ECF subfamily)